MVEDRCERTSEAEAIGARDIGLEMSVAGSTDAPLAPTRKRRLCAERQKEWEAYREYWCHLIAEWDAGHLTQREFCELHNVKIGTFAKWRKKFREASIADGLPTPNRKRRRRRTFSSITAEEPGDDPESTNIDGHRPINGHRPAAVNGHKPSAFVPLVVNDAMPPGDGAQIAVSWPDGPTLRVPLDTRADRVADLVRAIESINS